MEPHWTDYLRGCGDHVLGCAGDLVCGMRIISAGTETTTSGIWGSSGVTDYLRGFGDHFPAMAAVLTNCGLSPRVRRPPPRSVYVITRIMCVMSQDIGDTVGRWSWCDPM